MGEVSFPLGLELEASGAPWDDDCIPGNDARYPEGNDYKVYLNYTKPNVHISVGGAVFKTQKLLGGRALVCDSFSRLPMAEDGILLPGVGWYAHREGYNVLYGDWSAKRYGDSAQRIGWWPYYDTPAYRAQELCQSPYFALQINMLTAFRYLDGSPNWDDAEHGKAERSEFIWHVMDQEAGIDVGTFR